jgi:hypothetical protein
MNIEDENEVPDMDAFDSKVGGALAKAGKNKVMDQVNSARKVLGKESVSMIDQEPDYIVRTILKVNFLDQTIAKIWGINYNKPIIIELKFTGPIYLEDRKNPPSFNLYQSSDISLEKEKLSDISSFGLEWQIRARLNEWLNGLNWPPKDDMFIIKVMNYMVEKINSCTKTCIICDGELPYQMIKPSVCSKILCVHSHEQYGLGADIATEIRKSSDVVDLLIGFCYAASTGEERRFNPFPIGVETKYLDENKRSVTANLMNEKDPSKKNLPEVTRVCNTLPSVEAMSEYSDTKSLKNYLENQCDKLAFPLLRWIITSNRAYLVKLEKKDIVEEMLTEHQYMFLSSPPEQEVKFQSLKKKHGSFWAFHGSNYSNWHSILRVGLKNYSNTEFMSSGAAYGAGIYLSPNSSTSLGYAHAKQGWSKSIFTKEGKTSQIQCLCLCEVIDKKYKANPHYVVPDESHVMTRYFFIYNGSSGSPNVEANKLKNVKSTTFATKT